MTYAKKIDHLLADLSTLVTSLNLLGRYSEAASVQFAITEVNSVKRDSMMRIKPWPIDDGVKTPVETVDDEFGQ